MITEKLNAKRWNCQGYWDRLSNFLQLCFLENLQDLARPTRMYHLEDVIATEFTHFDGFAYVPNDEKRAEFPEDEAIVNVYRERHQLLPETED